MKKTILYIACSVDGYIADKDGGVGWLGGDGSEPGKPGTYDEFIKTCDTVIFGYTTYNQIVTELSPGDWQYSAMQSYVLTHRAIENKPGITFTSREPAELVKELRKGDGKKIWICGGANVIKQLMREDLIDEYWLTVMPTVLGSGVKLFSETDCELKLRLAGTASGDGVVDLIYERRRA